MTTPAAHSLELPGGVWQAFGGAFPRSAGLILGAHSAWAAKLLLATYRRSGPTARSWRPVWHERRAVPVRQRAKRPPDRSGEGSKESIRPKRPKTPKEWQSWWGWVGVVVVVVVV